MARRVLIIDDEQTIRYALKRYFSRRNWETEECEDGQKALDKLLSHPVGAPDYDLIVCDIKMPGLTGDELYTALEKQRPNLTGKLIFSTGDATSKESDTLLRKNCLVIQKPFELATLDRLIEQVINRGSPNSPENPTTIQP